MALPYLGFGSYISIGKEVTWGTAVARTRSVRPITCDLERRIINQVVEDLAGNDASAHESLDYQSAEESGGSFSFYADFGCYGLTALLEQAMGAAATSGSGPYTHEFTLDKDLLNGLTIEQGNGLSEAEVFEGGSINRLIIEAEVGRKVRVTAEVIAETSGGPTTITAPTFITSAPVLHHQAGTMTWNSVEYTIQRLVLTIDNKLARRQQLGSHLTKQPARTAKSEVTIQVTLERVSNALKTAHQARTASDLEITFTGSGSNSLAIAAHNTKIWEYRGGPSGVGPITEQLTFRSFSDGTDLGLAVTVVNSNSAVI
jgi:hypothetical protein